MNKLKEELQEAGLDVEANIQLGLRWMKETM